jgi:hypothetical protein
MIRKLIIIFFAGLIASCNVGKNVTREKDVPLIKNRNDDGHNNQFSKEIPAYRHSKFEYRQSDKKKLLIEFEEPVVVSVAAKPEKWGFFQFPTIMRRTDGNLAIKWHLNQDAIEAYGNHQFGSAISKDGGKTWQAAEVKENSGNTLLPNGDVINIVTPKPIKVEDLKLPTSIGHGMDTYAKTFIDFYKLSELPESVEGVYLNRLKKGSTEWNVEQDELHDPGAARYSFKGLFPVVWWGDMQIVNDGSVIAGIYPGFYVNLNGKADPKSGIFFYRSADNGHSWNIQGRILYAPDLIADSLGERRMGFSEPAFTTMVDGSFLCVARTTDGMGIGPMYESHSTDSGKTWSRPKVIAPSGVLPRLLRLGNGVTVLAAGRPGVQLRFSTDEKGEKWSNAFELLPYKNEKDQVSCGYTGLIATGPDRFLIVYSDFKFLNGAKEIRKAIKVREVIISQK